MDEKIKVEKVTEPESRALITLDVLKPDQIFKNDDGVKNLLAEVDKHIKPKHDPNTDEGRAELRTLAARMASTKTAVDNLGKEYVADLKKITKTIDEKRKNWRDTMDAKREALRKPLTDYENAENARKQAHQDAMQQMRDLMAYDYEPDSADVEKRLAKVTELAKRDYEEFADQAATVADNASGRLGEKLAAVIQAEEDAAELAKLREAKRLQDEKDREERIRQEERDRIAAENAKAQESPQPEMDLTPPPADDPKPAPITSKPPLATINTAAESPEQAKRRQINQQIVADLQDSCMISESAAREIVRAVIRGQIKNMRINYGD